MPFLDLFPRIQYDITKGSRSNFQTTTNILFRVAFLKKVLDNFAAYYTYIVNDSDRPETLAENIYGSSEYHWVILYANNIMDPQYDWPLDYRSFEKYIINKYGSVEAAKTTIHHYEKVLQRTESLSEITTEQRFQIDYNTKTNTVIKLTNVSGNFTIGNTVYVSSDNTLQNASITATVLDWSNTANQLTLLSLVVPANTQLKYQTLLESNSSASGVVSEYVVPTVPYDYYLNLPEEQSVEEINMDGKTVTEIIKRDAISNYDYEEQLNENKRVIKIIKPELIGQIQSEFDQLTNFRNTPYLRRLF